MRRVSSCSALAWLALGATLLAHDPRTTSKDFQAALVIEGAGKNLIEYKAMHFNQGAYNQLKTNDQMRQRMSAAIWNKIGKAILEFDMKFGEETLAKGQYDFGVDLGPNDTFSLVFRDGAGARKIPLETHTGEKVSGDYLSVSLTPTAEPDKFVFEVRCGLFRTLATFHVPYLAPHEHPQEKPPSPR